ncbi:Hsp70 family protein, partial [Dactylosporangium sp. NPDC005572]|uniref:Hsp70 family protein n=1 Tax=Dactylosporangium sp. NPDC005572 TaxID=3156889 RepID=UPI0033A9A19E
MADYWLGVDYGTSNTIAMIRWSDGRVRQMVFDGSALVPSGIFASSDGRLVAGRDAQASVRLDPARFLANPKRHIDDGDVLLGDRVVAVADAIAATLGLVQREAERMGAGAPVATTLTCPASWAGPRRATLFDAAARAGMRNVTLLPEPVAAGRYFAGNVAALPDGRLLLVYDLGAGTFDCSILRRTGDGFDVVALGGLDGFGGLDIDAMVVAQVEAGLAPAERPLWARLTNPQTPPDRRHHRLLWDDARTVKEQLSRQPSAEMAVPLVERDTYVSREALERAAGPLLQQTVDLSVSLVREAGATPADLTAVLLVGGATRMPLVSTLLHRTLGIAATVTEQPEILVAEGAVTVPARTAPPAGFVPGPLPAPSSGLPAAAVSGPPAAAVSGPPPWGVSEPPPWGAPVSGIPAAPVSGVPTVAAPMSAVPGAAGPVSAVPGQAGPVSAPPSPVAPVSPPLPVGSWLITSSAFLAS